MAEKTAEPVDERIQRLLDSDENVWRFYKLSKHDKDLARKMGLVVHDGYKPASWEFRCQNCNKWFDKQSAIDARLEFTGTAEEYQLLFCQPNYYGDGELDCPFCKETNHLCFDWDSVVTTDNYRDSVVDNDDIRPTKFWKRTGDTLILRHHGIPYKHENNRWFGWRKG